MVILNLGLDLDPLVTDSPKSRDPDTTIMDIKQC
jgi:hypothetical protein